MIGARAAPDLGSRSNPATDYATAIIRLRQLEAADGPAVNPVCRTRALLHGQRTDRAIVLIHGISSCPEQFRPLAEQLFARGQNVLLARLPRHGLRDRMTTDPGNLRAEELRDCADALVDIASGLADDVIVVGLSAGGILAAWAAQYRPEVRTAVLIAPSLGLGHVGRHLQVLMMRLMLHLPDVATQRFYRFEDAAPYGYLGFSTRALGEVLRLGLAVVRAASGHAPAAQHIVLITNADDTAVNNHLARQLIGLWQLRGVRYVEQYEFERALHLHHDLVDVNNPRQKVDVVYPVLVELIDRAGPRPRGRAGAATGTLRYC